MAQVTRYFIFLSFRGTAYNGWQLQPGMHTVQGVVNKAFSTLLNEPVNVTGAGRTDTGVHAAFFCAHFDSVKNSLADDLTFLYNLNGFLPADISIKSIVKVKDEANARFDAISRTYQYTIATEKDPFLSDSAWLLYWRLDLASLNQASSILLNHSDFTSFSRLHGGNKTNICKVSGAIWENMPGMLVFTITADRFLRNMVRAITGTLIMVGRGKISLKEFEDIINGRDRGLAGQSAPAQGLSLTGIQYPPEIFI
ncbi:MAG TPA: tRNA pseudouridine(38-40) synthase TruA [Bacteroidales bacterium]|nr:tRNA pseudouridine(38-40) synthase TruA [Bacteroidales bacterium]